MPTSYTTIDIVDPGHRAIDSAAVRRAVDKAMAPARRAVDQLADMAAFAALYEHSTAEEVAEEAQPEAGLEDLRLRTPALRPVGCWCTGCAPLSPRAASRSALTFCRIPDS